jgi:hypothetical protein
MRAFAVALAIAVPLLAQAEEPSYEKVILEFEAKSKPHAPKIKFDPKSNVGGTVVFQFADGLKTTNFSVSSTTSRSSSKPGMLETHLAIMGNASRIQMQPACTGCQWETVDVNGWSAVQLDLDHGGADAQESTIWLGQFSQCVTAMTSPKYMREAFRSITPVWSVSVTLPVQQFQAFRDMLRKRSPGDWTGLTANISVVQALMCQSFALMQDGSR